jgi:hypothetical protein
VRKNAIGSSVARRRTAGSSRSRKVLATLVTALRIPTEAAARMEDLRVHVPGW